MTCGRFSRLARGRRRLLPQDQPKAAGCVLVALRRHARRARLLVPAAEGREILSRGLGEAGDELLDGGSLAVVAGEIEVHARLEGLIADQQLQHADDLGALLVDGRRVEVVDLAIGVGPDGMGEGAGVLDELAGAQFAHVLDALHGARAHVGGEFLVAEDGQALLQAELEPVPAGDAVAGPVVEILVRDDASMSA